MKRKMYARLRAARSEVTAHYNQHSVALRERDIALHDRQVGANAIVQRPGDLGGSGFHLRAFLRLRLREASDIMALSQ